MPPARRTSWHCRNPALIGAGCMPPLRSEPVNRTNTPGQHAQIAAAIKIMPQRFAPAERRKGALASSPRAVPAPGGFAYGDLAPGFTGALAARRRPRTQRRTGSRSRGCVVFWL